MQTIEELFELHTATAAGFVRYQSGDVTYVTNGFRNNGVIGFIKPKADDDVFTFRGIAVSAFCEATVQIPPFVARGNGGSGLVVLEPRKPMTTEQLAHFAAYMNTTLRWRFSWSRLATVERLRSLKVLSPKDCKIQYNVRKLLPARSIPKAVSWKLDLKAFALSDLFSLQAGDHHNAAILPVGDIPLISCGDDKNGICAFVDVPFDQLYKYKLTVAFNGMNTLTTKFHPYEFAAKDDVAVCTPLNPMRTSTLFLRSEE